MAVDTIRKRFPNQEQNEIHREKVEIPFLYIKWESIEAAKANLNPVAFCLWLYLARHKDGTEWIFSLSEFCHWCGCSENTGRKAKKELLDPDLGYLVSVKGKKTEFDFYEYPEILKQKIQEEKQNIQINVHKETADAPSKDDFTF